MILEEMRFSLIIGSVYLGVFTNPMAAILTFKNQGLSKAKMPCLHNT